MFACGQNAYGQLGLGDNTERSTFTAVPALPDGKVAKEVEDGAWALSEEWWSDKQEIAMCHEVIDELMSSR